MSKGMNKIGLGMVFAVFLGCGGSGSSGGGPFTTSVRGSKPLNTLTTGEKMQLCNDAQAYFKTPAVRQQECRFSGFFAAALTAEFDPSITDAQIQQACTQAVSECVSSAADAGAGSTTDMCNTSQTLPASCTATVADYSACVTTIPETLASAAPACSSITRASLNTDAGSDSTSATSSPACTTLQNKCPGILDATTAPDGGAP